ncbi:CDGSH iron-sulfur domain-containing protein [Kribbella sp. CA-293567]|uniref:CDGSH iron-sulfur domain-containing protein n=1 Tax=Kribbella sp. CA-293567 TaxID=3002436 RepID=UPI0022DE480A|nr:CDGSH iron-sulfur domain-containing protein [Kribbella sp. CA-293567]WBQ08206.1 CDGSH iron-sulfur domain-containing protein [Kribbella sp. CA-293567]
MSESSEPGAASIRAYPDGPLIVRGDFELRDEDGALIDPGRATIALCRCGRSALKPLCDGTHSVLKKRR